MRQQTPFLGNLNLSFFRESQQVMVAGIRINMFESRAELQGT
jgi:hypothetical protein